MLAETKEFLPDERITQVRNMALVAGVDLALACPAVHLKRIELGPELLASRDRGCSLRILVC